MCFGLVSGAAQAKDPVLASLTPEHFRDTAAVIEKPPDATVISTEPGYAAHSGPLRMVWNDEFLRAIIDPKTGHRSFEVDALIVYTGNWRSYRTATYPSAGAPQSVPLINRGSESANCAVGECTYTEHVAFPMDEELVRRLALRYVPGNPAMWSFKLIAAKGPAYTGVLSSAEFAGLLARADGYLGSLPAAGAPPATGAMTSVGALPAAAREFDLGIAGMAVAATEDHPDRAGVLIVAVDRGSAAQRSGVIIGDIVYEFDGRPIRGLAELKAAVAAGAANAAHAPVAIKVFRGVTPTTLTVQFP